MRLHLNISPLCGQPLDARDRSAFGPDIVAQVREYMAPLGYATTPLHELPELGRSLGIGALLVKDESSRSALGSFKALGGAYAVICLVLAAAEQRFGRTVPVDELTSEAVVAVARGMTVTCATDGNHGRSVAAGAKLAGCKALIFVHGGVSEARANAMREIGALVRRVQGSYDDSVAEAKRVAAEQRWHVVSDTASPGNEEVPAQVMQGYLVMVDEVLAQCARLNRLPTHVFLQAGVGGLAAAVAAHLSLRMPGRPPRFIVVEPDRAACLFHSAMAGRALRIKAAEPTFMAMLECYEPSLIAWRILERLAHSYIAIAETEGLQAMHRLAFPLPGDPFVLSGESGGAGLAGLMAATREPSTRESLRLDHQSIALVFNTEGDTDRAKYESLLARAGAPGTNGDRS